MYVFYFTAFLVKHDLEAIK